MKTVTKDMLELKPLVPDSLVVKQRGEYFLFYTVNDPNWATVNYLGALLLPLCDGTKSIAELISFAKQVKGSDDKNIEDEVLELFKHLHDISFVSFPGAESTLIIDKPKDMPITVYLNVTSACNLRCPYCYANSNSVSEDELTTEEIYVLLDDLSKLSKDVRINFSGGEPLLRKDLLDLALKARNLGLRTRLLTNGTLITKENSPQLIQAFDGIMVSLDGATEEVHESLRGKGTFAGVLNGIYLLLQEDADKVLVSPTVTSKNIEDIPNILDLPGFTPGMLALNVFIPAGRGNSNIHLKVTSKQLIALTEKLLKKTKSMRNLCGLQFVQPMKFKYEGRCKIGSGIICINSDGSVYPCHILQAPEFLAGNVRSESIVEIYRNSPVMKKFREFTVSKVSKCRDCTFRHYCGGGCRGDSYWNAGDLFSPSSYCEFLQTLTETYMWEGNYPDF